RIFRRNTKQITNKVGKIEGVAKSGNSGHETYSLDVGPTTGHCLLLIGRDIGQLLRLQRNRGSAVAPLLRISNLIAERRCTPSRRTLSRIRRRKARRLLDTKPRIALNSRANRSHNRIRIGRVHVVERPQEAPRIEQRIRIAARLRRRLIDRKLNLPATTGGLFRLNLPSKLSRISGSLVIDKPEQLAELLRQLAPRRLPSLRLRTRQRRAVLLSQLRCLRVQPLNITRQRGFLDLLKRLLLNRGTRALGRGRGLLGLYSVVFSHDGRIDQSG